jgi:predicted metalloendopeptidase
MIPNKTTTRKNKQNKQNKQSTIHKLNTRTKATCDTQPYKPFEQTLERLFLKNNTNFDSTNFNLENSIIIDLKKATNPSHIMPQNDYYSYINDRWIESYKTDNNLGYVVQVDDFRIVQDKVYRQLADIVTDYVSNDNTKHTKLAICMNKFYKSQITWNTNKQSCDDAQKYVDELDFLRQDKTNLWKLLGKISKNEMISFGSPILWSLNPDDKNPKVYKSYVGPGQLTLVDNDLYYDATKDTDMKYRNKYMSTYFAYLNDLFNHAFGKNHTYDVKDIYACEVKMAHAFDYDKFPEDPDGYNLVNSSESYKKYKFNWEEYAREIGFKTVPRNFVATSVNYLAKISDILTNEWNNSQWRTYFVYMYIRQQQRTNEQGKQIAFNFLGKFVMGEEGIIDINLLAMFGMGIAFSSFLNNEYIRKYTDIKTVNYAKSLAEDLKIVFLRILRRNKWLQPSTKKYALQKLSNFHFNIGSNILAQQDPLLDYCEDDKWGNLMKISKWRHEYAIRLEGAPVQELPVVDWSQFPPKFIGTQSYIVNAMYTPTENSITIPLAYLQKPFIDLEERGIEYNLTRIGFTIGHEMSHALDDWGSKYDATGKLNNWWTDKDVKAFKKIQTDVVKQYEAFAAQDGIIFDAWPSIGEDLADISGLTICREYLRDFQLKNEDDLPIIKLSFEAFFVYFAIQQRQKISQKAILAQLKTNPHPLDKYRCNVPLSRLPTFRVIYNIKKGDKMWWSSTNRVWE